MIDYQCYCQIRRLHTEKKLSFRQIARELKLHLATVLNGPGGRVFKNLPLPTASKLDPFKGQIVRLWNATIIRPGRFFNRSPKAVIAGRYSIVQGLRPPSAAQAKPAFLTLRFEPGECAQVDWGCAGSVPVGSTRRRRPSF